MSRSQSALAAASVPRLAHPQPQVADALVKLLREDAIASCSKHRSMVSGNRFAQLWRSTSCRVRRDIGIYDAARGISMRRTRRGGKGRQ